MSGSKWLDELMARNRRLELVLTEARKVAGSMGTRMLSSAIENLDRMDTVDLRRELQVGSTGVPRGVIAGVGEPLPTCQSCGHGPHETVDFGGSTRGVECGVCGCSVWVP